MPGPAAATVLPPTTPENAPARSVVEPEPVPHCLACVRTLQASAPLVRSMRMPDIAAGPMNPMLLQAAGARITAAPLDGVKPPNNGAELPDPQAASEMNRSTDARLVIGPFCCFISTNLAERVRAPTSVYSRRCTRPPSPPT